MSEEYCEDCGCPLEVCCGSNREKYVPVLELKEMIVVKRDFCGNEIIRNNYGLNKKKVLCYVNLELLQGIGLCLKCYCKDQKRNKNLKAVGVK